MTLQERYSIEMQVGEGSFSKVYHAHCKKTGAANAIKVISSASVKYGRPTMEVAILKKCKHPNIIALREALSCN